MNFQELINQRYSVRAYRPDPVEDEKLAGVLDAARLAPTAHNNQPLQFVVVHTAGRETELKRIYERDWFSRAPLVICACSIPSQAWVRKDGKNYHEVDVAIAMDHLIMAAADLGLGTCWIAAFDAEAAKDVLGLPDGVIPMLFTPLGYPADQPREKKRKALVDLIRYERW